MPENKRTKIEGARIAWKMDHNQARFRRFDEGYLLGCGLRLAVGRLTHWVTASDGKPNHTIEKIWFDGDAYFRFGLLWRHERFGLLGTYAVITKNN